MENFALNNNRRTASSSAAIEYPITQSPTVYNQHNMEKIVNPASLNSVILDFFANKLHPISMLNEGLFKFIIHPILQTVNVELTQQSVLDHILKTSILIKDAIKLRLKQTMFALKIDLIVGPELIIMGIHSQHIFNQNVHQYTLSLQQIRRYTTCVEIGIMILEVLNDYKIDVNQILVTTTDINVLDNMENHSEVIQIENYFKLACNDFFHFVGCTRTIPAKRLIQKCIKRFLNNSELNTHLNMCHDIIQNFNDLNTNFGVSNKLYFTLKPPFNCWKSTLEMVDDFLELKASYFYPNKNSCFTVTPEQVLFLEDFAKIFYTIQKLTIKLDDSTAFSYNTFSNLYILLMELKLIVKKKTRTKLGTIFLDELEKSFGLIMKDHIFLSAIYLDPRMRICLNTTQTNDVKILLTNLYKKMQALKIKPQQVSTFIKASVNLPSSSTARNNTAFQKYLESLEISRSQEVGLSRLNFDFSCYELQCSNRLPMETNILEFWSTQQNNLTELAYAIQAIPITQDTIEKDLLAYHYVQNNHLILSEVENILLVKLNCQFQYIN